MFVFVGYLSFFISKFIFSSLCATDPPKASKVPGGGASQSQNSAATAGGHSHQQRLVGASQSQSQFPFSPLASNSRAVVPQTALVPPVVSAVPVVHAVHRNVSEQRALPPLPPSAVQFAKHASVAPVSAVGVTRIDSTRTVAGTLVEHTLAETAIGGAVVAPLVSTDRRMSVVKEEPLEVVAVPVPNATVTTTTATATAIVNKKRGREEEPEPEAVITSITSAKACGGGAAANKDYTEESEDALFQETKQPQPSAVSVMPAHKRAKPSAFTTLSISPSTSPVTSPRNTNSNITSVAGRGSSRKDNMDLPVTVPAASKATTTTISTTAVPSLSAATTSSTSSTSSSTTTNPSRRSTTSNTYNYRNHDDQQEGDWVEALRGADRTLAVHLKQTQVAREKQQHSKDNDAHDEAHESEADEPVRRLPSACVIEKADLIGAFIGDHREPRRIMNGSQASAASSASSATADVRNVKVFRKNKICSIGMRERMSFTHKQLVLPKESERQIQVCNLTF